ncbi:hypothetical protein C1A50_4441 [Paenibacillus polymyxa]|nr:hypothetical protein C1A50_4441 [Paenibacillus polymyxa]
MSIFTVIYNYDSGRHYAHHPLSARFSFWHTLLTFPKTHLNIMNRLTHTLNIQKY